MGEYNRAYVAAIHYDPFVSTHLLLLLYGKLPYLPDSRHLAHLFRHHQVADNILHILLVEVHFALAALMVRMKDKFNIMQCLMYRLVVRPVNVITQKIKGNGPVHSAA